MKIVTHIKNWIFIITHRNTPPTFETTQGAYLFINHAIQAAKKWNKPGIQRALLCKIIKDLRKLHKQPIQTYYTAKQAYDQYFTLPNAITSFDHLIQSIQHTSQPIYLYKFTNECPVKGSKPHQYYINTSWGASHTTYRCRLGTKSDTVILLNFKSNDERLQLQADHITSYIYATQQQIDQFELNRTKYKMLSFQKTNAQKIIDNIDTLISKLK